jgi:hypothetical protein
MCYFVPFCGSLIFQLSSPFLSFSYTRGPSEGDSGPRETVVPGGSQQRASR